MPELADVVPVPPGINPGLSSCPEALMLERFGRPGNLTATCSDPTGTIRDRIQYSVDAAEYIRSMGYDNVTEPA